MNHVSTCDRHKKRVAGCEECRVRIRRYMKQRRLRLASDVALSEAARYCQGWVRELQAAGWRCEDIAATGNVSNTAVRNVAAGRSRWVQLHLFHAIQRAYSELRPFPGPSSRTSSRALAKGWTPPPPLPMPTWDGADVAPSRQRPALILDPVVVERLVDGHQVKANKLERAEAVRRLHRRGLNHNEISKHLSMNWKRVQQILEEPADRATA